MYHVRLALTPDQVKAMKHLAVDRRMTVTQLVTRLVAEELLKPDSKPIPQSGHKGK